MKGTISPKPEGENGEEAEGGEDAMTDGDTTELLNAVIPFAQQMLTEHGAFMPFGAVVSSTGGVALLAGAPDIQAEEAMIEFLVSVLKQQASDGHIRASALCYDTRVTAPEMAAKQEAICVELEHASERCARLFLPYEKPIVGQLKYGELFGSVHSPRVFRRVL